MDLFSTLLPLFIVLAILTQAIKIVREYERVVIFRLGRFSGVKGPGIFFIIPIIDRVILLDLRVFTIDVAKQVVITRDNVSVEVDAVIYYRVVDPAKAIIQVENYRVATSSSLRPHCVMSWARSSWMTCSASETN